MKPGERPKKNFGSRFVVLGLGVSGFFACKALFQKGFCNVIAYDDQELEKSKPGIYRELRSLGCRVVCGREGIAELLGELSAGDTVIVSPGVPLNHPGVLEAGKRGLEVIGELEWAWRNLEPRVPVVAVTGTNGKTTTTELIGSVCREYFGADRVFVGGNIGEPLSSFICKPEASVDVIVLEVSSFQLDTAKSFSPRVAVVLNISEDHLDRYDSFDSYARSKMSVAWKAVSSGGRAVLNGDDPVIVRYAPDRGCLFWTGRSRKGDAVISASALRLFPGTSEEWIFDFSRARVLGRHNHENFAAAALCCFLLGIPTGCIERVFTEFRPGSHRLEWVGSWKGIDFYDDSKATNVDATVKALEAFDRPLWLLVGGRDKGGSYDKLVQAAKLKCRGVLCFGEARDRIYGFFENCGFEVTKVEDLEEAFLVSLRKARPGDIVLLSPACSSFDRYRNYAERGDHFKALVKNLIEGKPGS
ncbi:UDP-N-acetylmuramoyl-L-alanine--D-glutamate ligase [Thermodesulforhabdus norvegica]|uniref:UDP-N-acetylmuramoylalanine--D-glutamate ligase n=1 Tax=Thermodesulforhabdus norvegica TaxID=39841 RepID=A0A1I4RGT2_9BACT|nr:UDP-N-acetylmuramoyl-L-alanine--D-glutamate ligase [Thermodesulforhabdus norvegica]SFM51130.1 UDP-N-acetylmuramoylalanine--D-glutamate ligase [Thermodesulforhabdus norvegica]